ncbi:hypothetical protein GCM10027610_144120 [Dactylosporangium cerinum]
MLACPFRAAAVAQLMADLCFLKDSHRPRRRFVLWPADAVVMLAHGRVEVVPWPSGRPVCDFDLCRVLSGGWWRDKRNDFQGQVPGDPSGCGETGNDARVPGARSGAAEARISLFARVSRAGTGSAW